jgi:hypothetical protein
MKNLETCPSEKKMFLASRKTLSPQNLAKMSYSILFIIEEDEIEKENENPPKKTQKQKVGEF